MNASDSVFQVTKGNQMPDSSPDTDDLLSVFNAAKSNYLGQKLVVDKTSDSSRDMDDLFRVMERVKLSQKLEKVRGSSAGRTGQCG
jgi:hypothetical protein